jgi:glucans biosynthesis protein
MIASFYSLAARPHRVLSLIALLFTFSSAPAGANGSVGLESVAGIAKKLAGDTFKPPPPIPEFLKNLTYDDYRDIRFDPSQSLWTESGGNFQVQFIHPGLFYTHAVTINTYDPRQVRKIAFSPKMFTYGRNKFAEKIPGDLGFAGFRLTYPLFKKDEYNHIAVFAGASYFRAVAKNQVFGLSARGLAIDTGLPTGEEFPSFREFWLETPEPGARSMKFYALLDSPSLTGAYEFVIRPGERTAVDVRARLFERKKVKELGIAPLTSMFLHGEMRPRAVSEWRPEVHDSDGLLIATGAGERIWRPLLNPQKLLVSYFDVENPRGFGLLQRDRRFQSYEDLETRQELRPTAWITPLSPWQRGQVKLVEIPSPSEHNDNIVAYWIPKSPLPAGSPFEIAYRINFQSDEPLDNSLARVVATRIGAGEKEDSRRVVLDFDGGKLKNLASGSVKATITVTQEGQLLQQNAFKNTATGGWRVAFQVKRPKDKPFELRAFLHNDKEPLTETWSFQLEP